MNHFTTGSRMGVFCPYRVSPLGAHIDHQFGKINGLAIDKGIYIAYGAKQNGVVEMQSLNFPKRARFHIHAVPEQEEGDLEGYGRLMFESGASSIHNYECGCQELIKLYDIMTYTKGIYGGRFSGAGFKGCCMALIDPDYAEEIEYEVGHEYLKAFPALEGKYSSYLCSSADGVSMR
jgi:galactokinase